MSTILIVEDERAISEVIVELLEEDQHAMLIADNGQDALALLQQQLPDLVICDVMMPLLDGRALCRAIKSNPATAHIPIIMMSAGTSMSAADCSFDAFIYKPFDVNEFMAVVDQVLDGRKN